jgi:hypothetical protein
LAPRSAKQRASKNRHGRILRAIGSRFRSAGVPPAVFTIARRCKTAGGRPALPKPRLCWIEVYGAVSVWGSVTFDDSLKVREWYYPLVRYDPRRRISRPGGIFTPSFTYSVLTFLAATFLTGVVVIEANAPACAASRHSLGERGISQEEKAKPAATASPTTADRLGDHYLMLVNTARASRMEASNMAQFDRSPYDGLAVSFLDAYETSPVPSLALMQVQIATWKNSNSKHIWPWVYLNRMVGANSAEGNQDSKVPYFQRFQGLDLDGKAGAQNDFLENWRNALRLAKQTGVPGVVCDLEFYNNYKAYDLAELARMTSRPQQEVVGLLRQVGARMADISSAEYPGASIWFLFTGFTRPERRGTDDQPYDLAATYIVEGMLDQIQQHHLPVQVLSGGEVGLGYCHKSVDDLRQAIAKRAADFAPILRKYNGILELAGTMTLWSDRPAKKNWVAQGVCAASSADTVEDLVPYMELMFRSYRYNWFYGSPNGGYFAFQSWSAPRFDAAIAQAKARAYGPAGGRPGL